MKLVVEDGSFAYVKGHPIIQDLNFKAESGNLIAILGPNGAGKTTLLRCIMGLLKWDGGCSTLDGQNIYQIPSKKLWQKVSYVPQARGAFASFTAEDMILLGCTSRIGIFSTPHQSELDLVHKLAADMGIDWLLQKRCTEISGGELQMVLIARALAAKPQLLILDEPESNLDFKNQLIVLDTMTRLANQGMCCIFNTHYPNHALMRSSQSLILQKGGESIFGETSEIVTETNIEKAFGVKAIIGQIETPGHIYPSVMPLKVTPQTGKCQHEPPEKQQVTATIAMILTQPQRLAKIKYLLQQYQQAILNQTKLPPTKQGMIVLNVTLMASLSKIKALTHQIEILPDVNVKTTIAEEPVSNAQSAIN